MLMEPVVGTSGEDSNLNTSNVMLYGYNYHTTQCSLTIHVITYIYVVIFVDFILFRG